MRPEDYEENAPGRVEMTDGVFAFTPDPLSPDVEPTHELSKLCGEGMYAVGRLSDLERWLDTPEVVLSPMIHREAVDSSNIETRTRLTLSDIYRREAGGRPGTTETERADIQEANNYVEAIETGIQRLRSGGEIDRELICDLHRILLQGARGQEKNPGAFRDTLVGIDEPGTPISEARFVPAPPTTIPYALENLLQYVRTGPTYPPLIDLALIHYQFETIHPFQDGNGRLGRLLIMLALYDWELLPGPYLYPSAYFNANRDEYLAKLLAVSRKGEWAEWIRFFVQAIVEQGSEAYSVARDLLQLRDEYREQYQGKGQVIKQLIDFIIEQPYFTEKQAVAATPHSQPAINKRIRTLWEDGVVVETTGKERNRQYEATDVLEIVEPYR